MTRFRYLALVIGVHLVACGDKGEEEKTFATLFPEDNAIGNWVIDDVYGGVNNPEGLEIATTDSELNGLIDGGMDPFTNRDFVNYGREYYANGEYEAMLWIVELPDSTVATDLYDYLATDKDYEHFSSGENITVTGADAARLADDGLYWDFHARKDAYFVGVDDLLNDAGGRTKGEEFLTGVLAGF